MKIYRLYSWIAFGADEELAYFHGKPSAEQIKRYCTISMKQAQKMHDAPHEYTATSGDYNYVLEEIDLIEGGSDEEIPDPVL